MVLNENLIKKIDSKNYSRCQKPSAFTGSFALSELRWPNLNRGLKFQDVASSTIRSHAFENLSCKLHRATNTSIDLRTMCMLSSGNCRIINLPKEMQSGRLRKIKVKFLHSPILLQNKSVFPLTTYCFCHCFLYPRTECIMQYGAVRKFYQNQY